MNDRVEIGATETAVSFNFATSKDRHDIHNVDVSIVTKAMLARDPSDRPSAYILYWIFARQKFYYFGEALALMRDDARAIEAYKMAIDYCPSDRMAWENLACLYPMCNKYKKAGSPLRHRMSDVLSWTYTLLSLVSAFELSRCGNIANSIVQRDRMNTSDRVSDYLPILLEGGILQ